MKSNYKITSTAMVQQQLLQLMKPLTVRLDDDQSMVISSTGLVRAQEVNTLAYQTEKERTFLFPLLPFLISTSSKMSSESKHPHACAPPNQQDSSSNPRLRKIRSFPPLDASELEANHQQIEVPRKVILHQHQRLAVFTYCALLLNCG